VTILNTLIQSNLFDNSLPIKIKDKMYRPILTITKNRKGVLDVDPIKGCTFGTRAYPNGGCYEDCYAYKIAKRYGIDFTKSVNRQFSGLWHRTTLTKLIIAYKSKWYRMGTAGDPCHDWKHTISICRDFRWAKKIPVIITKHWVQLSDKQIDDLRWLSATINTSISGLDTDKEFYYRLEQFNKLKNCGINSVLRIVTCEFGNSIWAKECKEKQDYLLSLRPMIDNPLRPSKNNHHVLNGDIATESRNDSVGGGKLVSLHTKHLYLSYCETCPDQCGVDPDHLPLKWNEEEIMGMSQINIFDKSVKFEYVQAVIGSGYEKDVATLAIEDGIAHRAARKNMQIHSAIILKINNEFSGFMTFQNNDICNEFCLLQSVIKPEYYNPELYRDMVVEVLKQNKNNYPAIITTDPHSKFETPKLFESIGFQTYLEMSGYHYMVKGSLEDIRMKLLAHITMTNVWNPNGANWLKVKKEWNRKINEAGEKQGIQNPLYASRDGCWQGTNGFANVVTGHAHNGNASVLDPVVCEVVLRFFMPANGKSVYNPFGGGVQFGFISGSYGYKYIASEIRQNQCDANNMICSDVKTAKWLKSNSAEYIPEEMFDLVFCCPPYYKVEKYIDYDGVVPDGEINSFSTYADFRKALFSGYKISIDHLNENCFIVIMTGDSRDNKGGYYCSEAETELFLKECGLTIYNRIVYVESEFTRLAHAKKTLNTRKFPKREQKIIVAFKGDTSLIKNLYRPLGRL
jgi:hypothetical protein